MIKVDREVLVLLTKYRDLGYRDCVEMEIVDSELYLEEEKHERLQRIVASGETAPTARAVFGSLLATPE